MVRALDLQFQTPELSMGWVDTRVGLGRDFSVFGGLGWVHCRKGIMLIIIIIIIYLLKSTEREDAHMINTRTRAGQERHRKLALTFCP